MLITTDCQSLFSLFVLHASPSWIIECDGPFFCASQSEFLKKDHVTNKDEKSYHEILKIVFPSIAAWNKAKRRKKMTIIHNLLAKRQIIILNVCHCLGFITIITEQSIVSVSLFSPVLAFIELLNIISKNKKVLSQHASLAGAALISKDRNLSSTLVPVGMRQAIKSLKKPNLLGWKGKK